MRYFKIPLPKFYSKEHKNVSVKRYDKWECDGILDKKLDMTVTCLNKCLNKRQLFFPTFYRSPFVSNNHHNMILWRLTIVDIIISLVLFVIIVTLVGSKQMDLLRYQMISSSETVSIHNLITDSLVKPNHKLFFFTLPFLLFS
jgi:uncharacterized integral membrane protein